MKKNFKKIAGTTLMAASLLTLPAMANEYEALLVSANPMAESYRVTVNNNEVPTDVYQSDSYTMIKLRDVADACGWKLLWNPETEMVGVEFGENKFEIKPGENTYQLNEEKGMFYGKSEIKEGRTYMSPEFFDMVGMICVVDGNQVQLIRKESMPENSAVIKSMSNGVILVHDRNLGEVELIPSADTKFYDEEGNEILDSNLYPGNIVEVIYSDAMTLSLPPMNNPLEVRLVNADFMNQLEIEGTIETIGEDFVVLKDVKDHQKLRLNLDENTVISHITGNRRLYRADDLKEEMKVKAVVSNMFTRSLPAQTYSYGIIICE